MTTPAAQSPIVHSVIRLPQDLRDRIRAAARANGRSMNAEYIARLEASFADLDIDALAEKLAERLKGRSF